MHRFLLALAAAAGLVSATHASDWPAWRGPTGQGLSDEKGLPVTWSEKENVKWKIPLEHQGNSTPVIWKDKIFLTQADKGGKVRSLLCFQRSDGKKLWQKDVPYAEKEKNWNENWYANASPVTDGQLVVVSFGSAGMFCYDFKGNELWKRTDLGKWTHIFGNSSSPILHENLAILLCGPNEGKGGNYLLAVDKTSGKTVWQKDEAYGAWATPLLANVNGKDQILIGMSRDVKGAPDEKTGSLKGYDAKSGTELWHSQGIDSYFYSSALYAKGIAVGMSGYQGQAIAVKLGGSGDITKDILWRHPQNVQRVGSGVIVSDFVYMIDENGLPHCYELTTGNDRWKGQKRLGLTWGSSVYADGRIYVLMREGQTHVLKADPNFELIATNKLAAGEQSNSSPAISDGEIFLRTFGHLWCISSKR